MKKAFRIRLLAFAVLVSAVTGSHAQSLPAAFVKIENPFVIDGDPRDWAGITAEQVIVQPGSTEPIARYKLAWDDRHFYAMISVTDGSPMKNGSTVFQELLKGGDAISLCFAGADGAPAPQRIMFAMLDGKPEVITMRPKWADKTPYTYFTQAGGKASMDHVWRLPDARLAVRTAGDGYIAEIALSAESLGLKPAGGLMLGFDVQVILSDPAGSMNAATAWWHSTGSGPMCTVDIATEARLYPEAWGRARLYNADPGPRPLTAAGAPEAKVGVPIPFSIPRDAHCTLNIMDDNGWVVRELLRVKPLTAGTHMVYWDGRDRWGSPMPPGNYRWRLGYLDSIKATFAASVGNSGRPPYRTADGLGSIGGGHDGPRAVGADAEGIYMLNGGEEGQKVLRKIDPATGKAFWFASCGTFGGGHAIAADDRFAYMVYSGVFSGGTLLARLDAKTGRNTPIGPKKDPLRLGDKPVAGVAVAGGKAFFSVTADNRIGVIDLATGEFGKDIPVPAPGGLCTLDDSTLLVCSQNAVVKLPIDNGQTSPLLADLDEPRAVTTDRDGTIYVSELGKRQQIRKYSSVGKLIGSIGVAGGRPLNVPKYDPLAFRNVVGLAVGPDANLWAVEYYQPRRYVKLSRDGRWLEDFYGPNNCGFIIDLNDPSTLYYGSGTHTGREEGDIKWVETKIDYEAYAKSHDPSKGFYVQAIHTLSPNGTDYSAKPDFFTSKSGPASQIWGDTLRSYIFTATHGKRYLWRTPGLWRWDAGRWKPAAIIGAKDAPFWSDANGDGLAQPDEISNGKIPVSKIHYIDRDLTLYGMNGTLKPARVDDRGVPSYAGGAFTSFFNDDKPPLLHFNFDNSAFSPGNDVAPGRPDAEGSLYFSVEVEPANGKGFWDRYSEGRIVKVKDRKVQWIVGHHSQDGDNAKEGDTMRLTAMTGEVDGVVLFADVNGQFVAYSTDGLCLGWAFNDGKGGRWDPIYIENMATGEFFKDPKTGKRLLVSWTTEDIRVFEISGAFGNDITRVNGSVTLPTAAPRSEGLAGQYAIPYSSWSKVSQHLPYPVDGYDGEWAANLPAIHLRVDNALVADLRLRRDAGSLCIFADVADRPAFPPTAGAEPAALFGVQQGVELLIGPPAPERTQAGPGDTRIFLTATRDASGWLKGHALACRPASDPLQPTPELRTLNQEGGYDGTVPAAIDFSTGFAEIPGARIKVKERQDRQGYRIEAEIPLALFPEVTKIAPITFNRKMPKESTSSTVSDNRSDLAGPIRFNAAAWIAGRKGVSRVAWVGAAAVADPKAMDPSTWGWANLQVELQWNDLAGSPTFSLYRSTTPNPADARLEARGIAGYRHIDNPGLGEFHYWLVPTEGTLEGQWLGPVQPQEGRVDFGTFTSLPATPIADLKDVFVYPGTTRVISLRPDGKPRSVAVTVAMPKDTAAGRKLPVELSVDGVKVAVTVIASPVQVNAYRAVANVVTRVAATDMRIDSTKAADGDAGRPCTTQVLAGRGTLAPQQLGRHGYVVLNWKGRREHQRKVCAPFEDTFAHLDVQYSPKYGNCTFTVDGESSAAPEGQGQSTPKAITVKVTDTAEHVVSIFNGTAFGHTRAVRYSVTDPATGTQWPIIDLDGTQGQTLTQIRFVGSITFTMAPLKPGNRENIAAIWLD